MGTNFLEPNTDRQIAYVGKWLELASSIGTKILKINIGEKPPHMSEEQAFEQAKGCVRRCLPLAEEYGIPLAPELYPPTFPSGDLAAMTTLMKVIDSRYFRHTIDNEFLPPKMALAAYALLAPYAINVHASVYEYSYMKDEHKRTGKARFEFEKLISILSHVSYKGYIMIEWKGRNMTVPECVQGLRRSANRFRNLLAT
jgi:sugar phosphate isomerase/epimerase